MHEIVRYGVATISRLLKIVGLFCRISSLLEGSFAKETYNVKEPTNRSHPIHVCTHLYLNTSFLCEFAQGTLLPSLTHFKVPPGQLTET